MCTSTCLYAGTKAATDCTIETLRLEMAPSGVKVVTVITGSIKTNISVNATVDPLPADSYNQQAATEFDLRSKGLDVKQHSPVENSRGI